MLFAVYIPGVQAQDSILKDFAHQTRKPGFFYPICLYPSTLRMINISDDAEFNALVNDIEKILIYEMDSATVSQGTRGWLETYEEVGFEEYLTLYGKQFAKIMGKDDEMVGLLESDQSVYAFYLKGHIRLEKIPTLIGSLNSDDFIGIIKDRFQ